MAQPVSPAFAFHNRFAHTDAEKENKSAEEGPGFQFQFKDFTDFSSNSMRNSITSPPPVGDDKRSESSHYTSSADSYSRASIRSPVAALEAAVENTSDRIEGPRGYRPQATSSHVMHHHQTAPPPAPALPPSTSNFQQLINGYGPRSTRPQAPTSPFGHSSNGSGASFTPFPRTSSSELESAVDALNLNGGRVVRMPQQGLYGNVSRINPEEGEVRSRPSSFFGMDRPLAATEAAASSSSRPLSLADGLNDDTSSHRDGAESVDMRPRRSSFFGMEQPVGHVPVPERPNDGPSQAARIAASHRNAELSQQSMSVAAPGGGGPLSASGSTYGGMNSGSNSTTRPASIAPTLSGALLDHSHLKPGQQAALLSHNKTLELYRHNAKKTNDPDLIYEFAVFMIDAAKSMETNIAGTGSGTSTDYGGNAKQPLTREDSARDELSREALGLLKKIADRGHMDAQYFLADCYANGIGSPKGKQDFDRAYPLFVLAAKHGHPDAAYRAGTCYEKGWGCRKDVGKALQFYRKAASQSHPGAMYRLSTAELNGDLGLKKSAREGVKWLKRSAESATPEFPHALHELALLHERGVDNVLFVDEEYACELLAQAAEMGYAPSAYKLGVNYEYGRMGCPQDGGLSIHMYNIAAQQNHKEACFALTAWYLVGAPGILPQSDTEAYLWAKKAAEQGLAKAEYAVGYFTEMGIGTVKDATEARAWYRAAAVHGDKRANQRLAALGGQPVPPKA